MVWRKMTAAEQAAHAAAVAAHHQRILKGEQETATTPPPPAAGTTGQQPVSAGSGDEAAAVAAEAASSSSGDGGTLTTPVQTGAGATPIGATPANSTNPYVFSVPGIPGIQGTTSPIKVPELQGADSIYNPKTGQFQTTTEISKDTKVVTNASGTAVVTKNVDGTTTSTNIPKDVSDEHLVSKSKKYDKPHVLKASQDDPAKRKYINFKQDYVVMIRKKPFYASTAQQRTKTVEALDSTGKPILDKNGKKTYTITNDPIRDKQGNIVQPEENYLRVYQVNNFTNIRITSSVFGKSPGTCSVTIRGAERVVCAENTNESGMGWLNWEELMNGWLSINENGVIGDHTGTGLETTTSGSSLLSGISAAQSGKYTSGMSERLRQIKYKYNLSDEQASKLASSTNGKSWKTSEDTWSSIKDGSLKNGTTFKNLMKTREAKYGWKFAEKCDWEPMDEIWIFGKSRSCRKNDPELDSAQRDKNGILLGYTHDKLSEFKFEPLFFGYIDTVVKTYTANKGGCLISVTARDHLKLLELSRTITAPSFIPGKTGGSGLEINWSVDKYGFYDINQPYKDMAKSPNTPLYKKAAMSSYLLDNVLSGWYPDEVVQILGIRAGIPEHYLTKRVEPIRNIPFLPKIKSGNGDMMNQEMKTRLSQCVEAAEKLFIEFYADQAGNLVLKIPNYVLGVNMLRPNNGNIKYPDDIRTQTTPVWQVTTDSNGNEYITVTTNGHTGAATDSFSSLINNLVLSSGVGNYFGLTNGSTGFVNNLLTGLKPNSKGPKWKSKEKPKAKTTSAGEKPATPATPTTKPTTPTAPTPSASTPTAKAINDIIDLDNENVKALDSNRMEVTIGEWGKDEIGSLYDIANIYYGDRKKWKEIADANGIKDPTTVMSGDKIIVSFDENVFDNVVHTSSATSTFPPFYASLADAHKDAVRHGVLKSTDFSTASTTTAAAKAAATEEAAATVAANTGVTIDTGQYTFDAKDKKWDIANQLENRYKMPTPSEITANAIKNQAINNITEANEVAKELENAKYPFNAEDYDIKKKILAEHSYQNTAEKIAFNKINGGKIENQIFNNMMVEKTVASKNLPYEQKNKFRSGITDCDIIPIKPEYIISFSLMDSDKELYNMYEISGERFLGQMNGQSGAAAVPSVKRCVPDLDNILQFGMRPHPGAVSTPLAQNEAEAEVLGMMLILTSYANRYSGTVNVIDDPSIQVGNPIRIHLYDEHPFKNITWNRSSNTMKEQSMFNENIFPEQAVFYVTGIERNIDLSNTSTMTLQLKAGRMMGQCSVYDYLAGWYDKYYTADQHRDDYLNGNNSADPDPHKDNSGTNAKTDWGVTKPEANDTANK